MGWRNSMLISSRPRSCLGQDRKSTRLNSSHVSISYAVFCLKKKKDRRSGPAEGRGGHLGFRARYVVTDLRSLQSERLDRVLDNVSGVNLALLSPAHPVQPLV